MKYDEFRRFRDDLLRQRRPLRLDCMNPERALAAWEGRLAARPPSGRAPTLERAISLWPERRSLVAGLGIRELLADLLSCERSRVDELWLPGDVYPVYAEIARAAGYEPRSFATLPEPDWTFLGRTAARTAVLLPIPLSPAGRRLLPAEVDGLLRWLKRTPDAFLIVDAAYTYEFAEGRPQIDALLDTAQAAVLWSCSKPWILSRSLGLAAVPERLGPPMRDRTAPPAALPAIVDRLERHPDLPRLQQEAFRREWSRIEPRLRALAPEWRPPETGYFSVVALPFEDLLNRFDVLGVPASVFGSTANLTVVTCLHDLAEHER